MTKRRSLLCDNTEHRIAALRIAALRIAVLAVAVTVIASCTETAPATAPDTPTAATPPVAAESIRRVTQCVVPPAPSDAVVTMQTDVRYAVVDGRTLSFDLATPSGATSSRPLVVLFHGGGFRGGDKRALQDEIRMLASLGYAAASVNYRLTSEPRYVFPAPFSDARCALRVLAARAATFRIDASRIAIGGTSAGGALALAVALNSDIALDAALPQTACDAGAMTVPRISALVSWYGGGETRDATLFGSGTAQALAEMLGGTPTQVPLNAALVSPLAHVDRADPPTLHLHGVDDDAVQIVQAVRLDSALRAVGVPSLLVSLPGIGHGFAPLSSDAALRTVTCTALGFLSDRLRP